MALNVVGALFLLQIDNEAFAYEYIGLRLRRNRGGLTVPRGGRPSGPGRVKKKTVR